MGLRESRVESRGSTHLVIEALSPRKAPPARRRGTEFGTLRTALSGFESWSEAFEN